MRIGAHDPSPLQAGARWAQGAVPVRLEGALGDSPLWRQVRRSLGDWFERAPHWARGWTLVVRPKTQADDDMLVEDGEADDPTRCWALCIDGDSLRVTLAVATAGVEEAVSAADAAGFLIELIGEVADPSGY